MHGARTYMYDMHAGLCVHVCCKRTSNDITG